MKSLIPYFVLLMLIYTSIACFIFELRNPTANRIQLIVHIVDVYTLKKLDKFQGN